MSQSIQFIYPELLNGIDGEKVSMNSYSTPVKQFEIILSSVWFLVDFGSEKQNHNFNENKFSR